MTSSPHLRRRSALASALVAAGVLITGAVSAGAATPAPSTSPVPVEDQRPAERAEQAQQQAERRAERDERKAERTAERDERKAERKQEHAKRKGDPAAARPAPGPAPTGPAFVCDPALSHGRNVSAYARSLPRGPGRGRLVSQAARTACGTAPADD